MKKNKLFISMFVGLSSMLIAALSFSFAWFKTQMIKVTWGDMAGSILEQYFDRKEYGDFDPEASAGSEDNPFVITTPKHYENLVKLHHVVDDNGNTFGSKGFCFEIGKQFSTDGEYEVYGYDDNGVSTGSKSYILNLGGLNDLEPIGSSDNPFISNLDGHGITVKNFTVSPDADNTTTYNDVGIFGYVGEAASCKNTYWGNFTIDPKGAGLDDHEVSSVITPHEDDVRIGYLAGHIVNTNAFTNCYVNNCQIKSGSCDFKRVNMYGYYGLAERDVNSGSYGKGSSYQFRLDSKDIYSYFSANYRTIRNQQLVLRNTAESGREEVRIGGDIQPTPFSNVIQNGTLNSYDLNSPDRVPSLSTIGYVSGPLTTTTRTDPVFYNKDNNMNASDNASPYGIIPSEAEFTETSSANNVENGDFIYYNEAEDSWSYYHNEKRRVQIDSDRMTLHVRFKNANKASSSTAYESRKATLTGSLFLTDNNNNLITKSLTGSGTTGSTITWSCNEVTFPNLPLGDYGISAQANISWDSHDRIIFIIPVWSSHSENYILAGNRSNAGTNQDPVYKLNQTKYQTSYILRTNGTIDGYVEIDLNAINGTEIDSFPTESNRNKLTYTPIEPTYILTCETTFNAYLYYLKDGQYYILKGDDDHDYHGAIIEYIDEQWMATYSYSYIEEGDATNHFVAEEDAIHHGDDEPGYRSQNIDVVGPQTSFYRYTLGNILDVRVIRMASETRTNKFVNAITSDDIGQPFYAPSYAMNSIVLYIKNVYNAAAHRNEDIGTIEFRYTKISILGYSIDVVTPSFRKGSGVYANLNSVGDNPTTDQGNMEEIINVTLKENAVQAACYCCLDRNGNILGTFNADGTLGVGLTEDNLKDIYTYVMLIGGYNSNNNQWGTWVTRVDFDFTAEDGYGGNFGSVGYRSSPDTIVSTILNFYLEVENFNLAFCIKVDYLDNVYTITLLCNAQMNINVYNYDSANYQVLLNGQDASRNNTVAPNGYAYPADA